MNIAPASQGLFLFNKDFSESLNLLYCMFTITFAF